MKLKIALFAGMLFSVSLVAMNQGQDNAGKIICKNVAEGITANYESSRQELTLLEEADIITVNVTSTNTENQRHLKGSYRMESSGTLVNVTLKLPLYITEGQNFNATLVVQHVSPNMGSTIENDPNITPPEEKAMLCTLHPYESQPARR
jgi:hypothetical protein